MMFENEKEQSPLYYFECISQIPRESGNEKAVSDYIFQWARELGLEAEQDWYSNLIIKKPATRGYEQAKPVILQAHMDMVCEKDSDSMHDFQKDSIVFQKNGDWLVSATGTTLGADNGIGVGYLMAILADKELKHPAIEAVFTTEEETTFRGIAHLDYPKLEGTRLINLDHSVENEVLCGSCGGCGVRIEMPLEKEVQSFDRRVRVKISGLKGGHSGEDIHRGRGNAIQVLARVLERALELDGKLISVHSGTSRTAIPREAEAVFGFCAPNELSFEDCMENLEQVLKQEYAQTAPNVSLDRDIEAKVESAEAYTESSAKRVMQFLTLFPNGIMQMSAEFPGLVESSINLGIVNTLEESTEFVAEIRGSYPSTILEIQRRVQILAELFDSKMEMFDRYEPWTYHSESPLREKAKAAYEKVTGERLNPVVVHAGIECGFFLGNKPELDAISIGPEAHYFHSPQEKLSISSSIREWKVLRELLEMLG